MKQTNSIQRLVLGLCVVLWPLRGNTETLEGEGNREGILLAHANLGINQPRRDVFASIPLPRLDVPVPDIDAIAVPDLHVAVPKFPGDEDEPAHCTDLEGRVNAMEESILDFKARYWAARMKEGRTQGLISNPGSEILSRSLRRRFFERVKRHYARSFLSSPAVSEMRLVRSTMSEMLLLVRSCGGEAPELRRAIRQTEGGLNR